MVSMHRHHDMSFVTVLMLMPIKSASLFSQPFPECGAFHSVLLTGVRGWALGSVCFLSVAVALDCR